HAFDQAKVDRHRRIALDGHQHAAALHKLLQMHYALEAHAAAHIVGGVGTPGKVWSQLAALPRNGIAAHRQPPHDALRRAASWWEDDHVKPLAQVRSVANDVVGD